MDRPRTLLPIQDFLDDWHVRATWIAFMTLWVFWGLSWFVRNAFGGDSSTHVQNIQSSAQIAADPTLHNNPNQTGTTAVDPESGAPVADPNVATTATPVTTHKVAPLPAPAWSVKVFNRLNRAHDLLRDLILMLLSVLTLNTFARASTRAVMIIAWFYVGFAFVTFVIEASYEHRYLRFVYTLVFYALALAIAGLAFAEGFFQ
jgi:hypothetical protein